MASKLSTAWSEYNQGFVQHPGLVIRLHMGGGVLADVREAQTRERFSIPDNLGSDHMRRDAETGTAPTQVAAQRRVDGGGVGGLRFDPKRLWWLRHSGGRQPDYAAPPARDGATG